MTFNFRVLCFSIHLVFANCFLNDLGEVVFVSILYRHGDRTPIDPYPTDPYRNNSLWPADWGQMTNIGKKGHYKLGKWLRERYSDLLPEKYKKDDIYIRSTDVDRTLMSAYSNLAGLYEPDLKTNWNPNIAWTPIPVHTTPQNLDEVLAGEAPCTKYNIDMKNLKNSQEFKGINEKYQKVYEYLSKHTGMNVTDVIDAERIHDTLFIESLYNFTLPNWTRSVYPQPLKEISEFTFLIPCYTQELARLKIGPLLGEMLGHMSDKISGKLKQRAWMYSAHDTTVANVLKALDLFQPHCPPYLSLILIELRRKNQDYFVAIHYKNSTSSPPYFFQLKGCDKLCPFQRFRDILSPLVPDHWHQECQAIRFAENFYDSAASITLITMVSLAFIFIFSLGVVVKLYKNPRWNQSEFAYRSLKLEVAS